jgi:hypothetical protein
MSQNLWDDEEATFPDMPDEVQLDGNGQPIAAAPVSLPRPAAPPAPRQSAPLPPQEEEEYELDLSEAVLEEEDDFSLILNDANLRLEQGSLYKLIMRHDLFEGVDADPKAVQSVQRAIRKFAKEQMEIMLGMRKEVTQVEHLEFDFPFNALEVDVLKRLAFTATKGATQNSEDYTPSVKRVTEETPVKRKTLNPIGSATGQKKAPQTNKPLPARTQAPVKRTKRDATIDQIAREEGVPRELLEEDYVPLDKPAYQLTEQEKHDRNKQISARRGVQVKNPSAIPMPTLAQEEFLAQQMAARAASALTSQGTGIGNILSKLKDISNKT